MKSITFIDGANLYAGQKSIEKETDYNRMKDATAKFTGVPALRQMYFATVRPNIDHDPMRPLLDFLSYNGFHVVEKYLREYQEGMVTRYKGSAVTEIAVAMVEMAPVIDHITLFSGDGDLVTAVQAVQRKGVQVTVISPRSMISDELRRQADQYIELEKIDMFKTTVTMCLPAGAGKSR